jgi:hypothetical protein
MARKEVSERPQVAKLIVEKAPLIKSSPRNKRKEDNEVTFLEVKNIINMPPNIQSPPG